MYKDKTCQNEVVAGFVSSGMYAKYKNNDKLYKISVFGDINSANGKNDIVGDGILNQIELTRTIRHYVKAEGWNVQNEEEKKSLDLTCNNLIDDDDIKKQIDYIVYDKLNVPPVKDVKEPKVEVVEGKLEEEGRYVGKVKVKITTQNDKENTKNTVYKITGTKSTNTYKEIKGDEEIIELSGEGIYKVTAYTYGKEENKSKGTYQLIKIGNGIREYKVEHYKETLEDGKFELAETENLTGRVDDVVKAKQKDYIGFTYDEQNKNNVKELVLDASNNQVLKLYYKRNSYNLTLNKNENINIVKGAGTYKYGQTVNIDAEEKNNLDDGYSYIWEKWETSDKNLLQSKKEKNTKIAMPAGNLTLTAIANKKANKYSYEVNYYFDNEKSEELSYKDEAEFGSQIVPEINDVEEYEVENKNSYKLTIGTKDNVLNIYYKIINYEIKYNLDGGIVNENENPTSYNFKTNTFTLVNPTKQGYTFTGWTGSNGNNAQDIVTVEKGSTGNKEFTANYEAIKDTPYTVIHYLEALDGTYKEQTRENLGGETNKNVTAIAKNYTGFTYNKEKSTYQGIVKPDGTLVLKMYYTRNTYKLKLIAGENISKVKMQKAKTEISKSVTANINQNNNEQNNNSNGEEEIDKQEQAKLEGQEKQTNLVKENSAQNVTTDDEQESAKQSIVSNSKENDANKLVEETEGTEIESEFKYEEEININAELSIEEGYSITFSKWTMQGEGDLPDLEKQNAKITMPAKDIELTAKASKTTNKYKYTVEYYYDNEVDIDKTKEDYLEFGTKVTNYENKIELGYEFDRVEGLNLTIGTNEEQNIIKVYYKQTVYSIVYRNVANTVISKENPTTYTVKTNDIVLTNPEKPGYTFLGWTEAGSEEKNLQVTIPKGSTGNKEYTAHFQANQGIKYKVEHYIENLEGGYSLFKEEPDFEGTMAEEVIAEKITINGFTYDEETSKNTKTGIIKADGSLVLKLYYSRNSYNLKLKTSENILNVESKGEISEEEINVSYKYEEKAKIFATLKQEEGYTISFEKWESETEKISNQKDKDTEITMPDSDVILTAKAIKTINKYSYKVEYYYDSEIDTDKTKTDEENYNTVINDYEQEPKDGYEFDKVENVPLTIKTNEEANVIKVYYKLVNYNIICNKNGGSYDEGIENDRQYNLKTEDITLKEPKKAGYIFTGWTGITDAEKPGTTGNVEEVTKDVTIKTGSMGNRTYDAHYIPRTDLKYKVEHYTKNLEDDNYTLYKAEGLNGELTGTMDTQVTASPIEIEGFTYDEAKSKNTIIGTINAEENLTLKVYYSRNTYKVKLIATENIARVTLNNKESSEAQIEKEYKYEEIVNINASIKPQEGYVVTWQNWTSNNQELLQDEDIKENICNIKVPAGDLVLTANAKKNKDNFNYTVKYYYDGIEDTSKIYTNTAEFESQITEYTNKVKDGYEFDKTENLPLTIKAKPEENVIKVYYKLINYNITYNLDGGNYEEGKENLSTYNVKTEDFTLNNPVREGYKFLGWTGGTNAINPGTTGNTENESKTVTISKGSMGDRVYTANWQEIVYKVIVHHYLVDTQVKLAQDELLTSKVLGEEYTTNNLIPTYDDEGNIQETDEREYLDGKEYYEISHSENTTGTYTSSSMDEPIEVIYYYQLYPVIKVVHSPEESLIDEEYLHVADALEALKQAGLTKESEQTKLQLLKNVKNESVTIQNQNVEIDLANYTFSSNSEIANIASLQEKAVSVINVASLAINAASVEDREETENIDATIKLNNTKLQIVDNSESNLGKVVSKSGVGVYIKINSEFTLGKEPKPILQTPEIIGKTSGILKEKQEDIQGIFNFFDGKVSGQIAIDGTVDLTPVVYKTTVQEGQETAQQAVLAIVEGVEARIGRKLYATLEEAIQDAGTTVGIDGSQVEVSLVDNLSKTDTVVVNVDKNIKLNLDGYTLTSKGSAFYVIENYGKLEVVDESEEKTGKIYSTTGHVIGNMSGNNLDPTDIKEENTEVETVDLSTVKKVDESDTYFFEYEDGVLISNNKGKSGTYAYGYIELDLTEKQGKYTINIDAKVSSKTSSSYAYGTARVYSQPTTSTSSGRQIFKITNTSGQYSLDVVGGKTYYLNLCYRSYGSSSSITDDLTINKIELIKKKEGRFKLTSGTISVQKAGYSAISNYGTTEANGGLITGTASSAVYGICNQDASTMFMKAGDINGKLVGIQNNGEAIANITGGKIEVTGYAGIQGTGNLGELNFAGTLNGYIENTNADSKIYVKGGVISNKGDYAIKNTKGYIEIDGGEVNGSISISGGNVTVNGGIIRNTGENAYGNAAINGNAIINGGEIYSTKRLIYECRDVTINDGILSNMESTDNPTGIEATYGTVTINGGTINSKSTAIYISGTGTTNIKVTGGEITSSTGNAIYVPSATANITIGTKDGIVENKPYLKSSLSNSTVSAKQSKLYLYDGELYGPKDNIIRVPIYEVEEEQELILEMQEDNYQKATLGIPVENVAKIEGVGEFLTLQDAVDACTKEAGDTKTTIQLLKDINIIRSIKVVEGQNIVIDTNGKNIYAHAQNTFINGGKLEFKTDVEEDEGINEKVYTSLQNCSNFVNVDGKLINENNEADATGYVLMDLRHMTGKFNVTINVGVSSNRSYDGYGYATITTTTSDPGKDKTAGRFMYTNGTSAAKDYSIILEGGAKYYLHIGLDRTQSGTKATCTINSIKLQKLEGNFKKGNINNIYSYCSTILQNTGTATMGNNVNYKFSGQGTESNYQKSIKNTGTLNINGGNVFSEGNYTYNICNYGSGDLNIIDGNVSVTSGVDTKNIYNYENATTNVNGGNIYNGTSNKSYSIYNDNTATLNITSGRMDIFTHSTNNYCYGIYINSTTNVNIQDYKITSLYNSAYVYAVYNNNKSDMNLTRVNINNNDIQELDSFTYAGGTAVYGNAVIKDSIIDGYGTGIYCGTVDINNTQITNMKNGISKSKGTIKNSTIKSYADAITELIGSIDIDNTNITNTTGYGVYNYNWDSTNIIINIINNSTITANCGIYIGRGPHTINVKNSRIDATNDGINLASGTVNIENSQITSNKSSGVAISSGVLNVGVKDGEVDTEFPYIKGATYGVNFTGGTFNFYDGKIEGKDAMSKNPISTEVDYQPVKTRNTDTNIETAILEKVPIFQIEDVGSYNNIEKLQEAINGLDNSKEYTIKLLQDITIRSEETGITIPEGITVNLDLNKFIITPANNNFIVNNGTLNISDSSEEKTGKIQNEINVTLIENNGILNIDSIKITTSGNIKNNGTMIINSSNITTTGKGTSSNYKKVIVNTGTLELNNTNITNTSTSDSKTNDYVYIISNEENGILKMPGSTINAQNTTIYNNSAEELVLENVIIKCYQTINNNCANITVNGENTNIYNYYGIQNNNIGNITVNNGRVDSYSTYNGYEYIYYESIQGNGIDGNYGDIYVNGGYVRQISGNYNKVVVSNEGTAVGRITVNNNKETIIKEKATVEIITLQNSESLIIKEGVKVTSTITKPSSYISVYNSCIVTLDQASIEEINAYDNSVINLKSGTVGRNKSEEAININSSATCNIGEDDGTVNNNQVNITGYITAIGTLNYYDGTITTSSNVYGIKGYCKSIPEEYIINVTKDAGGNNVTTLEIPIGVASVGGVEYGSLEEAIKAVNSENNTITLLKDIYPIKTIEILEEKNVKIDLNGKLVYSLARSILFINNGTLEITDTSVDSTAKIVGRTPTYIKNTNNLTISGGYYYYNDSVSDVKIVYNTGNGTVNWNKGRIYLEASNTNLYQYGIYTDNAKEINIKYIDAYLKGTKYSGAWSTSYSYQYVVYASNNSEESNTINFEDGNIDCYSSAYYYGIYDNTNNAIINISGGTFTGGLDYAVYNNAGTGGLNISGGIFKGTIKAYRDTQITAENDEDVQIATLEAYRNIAINGGTIGTINNYSTNTTINGGNITKIVNGSSSYKDKVIKIINATINNTNGAGIYNYTGNTVILGNESDEVSTEKPSVTGSTYGIENYGTFNFYDGVIIGGNEAIYGSVTKMPELYGVSYSDDNKKAILEVNSVVERVATVDGINYQSLALAIQSAIANSSTVTLHKNVKISSPITIGEGKEATIDLNACAITYEGEDTFITNNGKLTIIDKSPEMAGQEVVSKIENANGAVIQNNGEVILGIDDEKNNENSPAIIGGIVGNGTLTIYDGKVE